MVVLEATRNGTVPLRVNSVDITLDELGYPGWVVTMRLNPRASVYDDLLNTDDLARWWKAFGKIVQSWNFADEDGEPFPLPSACESERDLDLPVGVVGFIFRRYIEEFGISVGFPKAPVASSEISSATSDEAQTGE